MPYPQELAHARRQLKKGDKGEVRGNILPLKRGADGELSLAMPQMLRDAGTGLLDLLAGTRTGEVTPEATGLLFDIAGGGAASAPLRSAGLGIFGGKLAKTADHGALQRAEQMAGEGADRGTIWKDTGWFQGADGKWRFEIDDSQSKIGEKALSELQRGGDHGATQRTAAGFLHHKALFDAYPQLRNIDVDARYNAELKRPEGSYQADTGGHGGRGQMKISTNALEGDKGARSIALHEFTHPVQDLEGFARGGNQLEFSPIPPASSVIEWPTVAAAAAKYQIPTELDAWRDVNARDTLNSIWDQMRQSGASTDELVPIQNEMLRIDEFSVSPYEQYHRLTGENDARNAQTRADYTPEERRARPPWETQDVPDEQQIVRFGSGPSLMASLAKGTANQAGKGDRLNPDSLLGKVAAGKGDKAGVESAMAKKYPMAPRDNWYGDANYQQTGGKLTEMTPDEFLAKSRPMEIDEVARENIDDLKQHILNGGELDPLAIYKSGKEDGRHRAHAAKELGMKTVPVLTWKPDK